MKVFKCSIQHAFSFILDGDAELPTLITLHPSISLQTPTQKQIFFRFTLAVYFALRMSSRLPIDVLTAGIPFGALASAISDEAQHSLTQSGVDRATVIIKIGRRS